MFDVGHAALADDETERIVAQYTTVTPTSERCARGRHILDDNVGHIGYSVRPTARRRGLASWALGQMLGEARTALGVDRVLIPCLADNFASARTIERSGGFLEGICDTERGPIRRYWIALDR